MVRLVGLILAAGLSSRMKAFKPLLPLGGQTVMEIAITSLMDAGIGDIRVVVGYRQQELLPVLANWPVHVVVNECYQEGMFSSVLTGVESIEPQVDGFFLLPVDYPLIRPTTISRLRDAFGQGYSIAYPSHQGRRGHPPLISTSHVEGILHWSGPEGLRGYLKQHDREASDIGVDDPGIHLDMDTPDDYARFLQVNTLANAPRPLAPFMGA